MSAFQTVLWTIILGLFSMLGMYFVRRAIYEKNHCKNEVKATIIDLHEGTADRDSIEDTVYYPEFQYTVDGETFIRSRGRSHGKGFYQIGQEVTLYYDPDNPKEFSEESGDHKGSVFMGGTVAISCLIAIIYIWVCFVSDL